MKERLENMGRYILDRLKEASTWRGLILVTTALTGFNVSEEKTSAIALIGLTVAGLVGMLFPDKKDPQ